MFSLPSWKIGTFFGIPVEVNVSWVVVFVLVAASLAFGTFPSTPAFAGWGVVGYALAGVLTALAFFASIVLHELSHSLVARVGGVRVRRVTLFMFGGVSEMPEEPKTAGSEFLMAVAGPAASLLLAVVFFFAETVSRALGVASWIWGPLGYLAQINLVIAIFNLLPGFPLDGGRVLRSLIWGATHDLPKATRISARAGQAIGYSMAALAVFGVLRGTYDFVWLGLIGWFIATLATGAYRQQLVRTRLSGVTVGDVMSPAPVVVPGEMTLEQLSHDYFLGGRHTRYPVMVSGHITGLVSLSHAKAIPRERWSQTRVLDAANTDIAALTIDASASVESAIARLSSEEPGALLVVAGGRLVGICTRTDVVTRLKLAEL